MQLMGSINEDKLQCMHRNHPSHDRPLPLGRPFFQWAQEPKEEFFWALQIILLCWLLLG